MFNHQEYHPTGLELAVSMISFYFGVGILTLPRILAEELDTADGWISVVFSGIMMFVMIYVFVRLQKKFIGQNVFEYLLQGSVSKWVIRFIAFLFVIHLMFLIAVVVRHLSLAIQLYLIDQTPPEFTVFLMLTLCVYATTKGLQGIIHINLMFVPVIVISLFFLFLFNMPDWEMQNLLPIMPQGISPVLKGSIPSMYSFSAAMIIFFWMGYLKSSEVKIKPLFYGFLVVTLFTVMVIILCFGVFSVDSTKMMVFPTIELAKEIDLAGGVFERLESLFLTIYIMGIFTTICVSLFLCISLVRDVFIPRRKNLWLPGAITFFVFIATFLPKNVPELQILFEWTNYSGMILISSLVLITAVTVRVRGENRIGKKSHSQNL